MGSSPQTKEFHMPEKSPQKPAGKKPGRSLKEKRDSEARQEVDQDRTGSLRAPNSSLPAGTARPARMLPAV